MKNRKKIMELLSKHSYRASEIARELGISTQAVHRHLRVLVDNGFLIKKGVPPHTKYGISPEYTPSPVHQSFQYFKNVLWKEIKKDYGKIRKKKGKSKPLDFQFLLSKGALFSSKIEGNSLNLNSFINSPSSQTKEHQEIVDLLSAYQEARNRKLNQENILFIHKQLSRHFLIPSKCGKYRTEAIGVFGNEGLVYLAVEDSYIQREMNILFEYIDELYSCSMSFKESIFWASWVHLMFVLIHPFADGNGRVARLLEKWFLAEKNGEVMWYLETEYFYFMNREKYYTSLHLGVNYWEIDIQRARNFVDLVYKAVIF